MALDELVIIKEDNLPPMRWKLGRVIELFPGPNNKIHIVCVKTKTSTRIFKRPITKLVHVKITQKKNQKLQLLWGKPMLSRIVDRVGGKVKLCLSLEIINKFYF